MIYNKPQMSKTALDNIKSVCASFFQKGVYHVFASFLITRFIDFVLVIVIARALGPADMGHLSVINSALAILAVIATFGLSGAVAKYVSETTDSKAGAKVFILSSRLAIFISIALSFLSFFIFKFSSLVGDEVARQYLQVLVFVTPFLVFVDIAISYIYGRALIKKKAIYEIEMKLTYAILALALVFPFRLAGIIGAKIFNPILWSIILFVMISPWLKGVERSYNADARKIIRFGFFTTLSDFSSIFIRNFDVLALGYFIKDASLIGLYKVAVLLAINLDVVAEAVVHTYYPDISRCTNDRAELKKLFWKLTRWTALIMVPVTFLSFVFAPLIFRILFGTKYIGAVGVFRILVFAPLIYAVLRVFGNVFSGSGRPDLSLTIVLLAGATNFLLNILLIPRLGISGAALALIITHLLNALTSSAIMYFYLFRK